ncbi:hypothetical protein BGX31_001377 [Mortierella sp. GBA43]|nr:hypothetical protein BGX31_001377 [Mortierella sp. GBA43]
MSANGQSSEPTKKMSTTIKSEPEHTLQHLSVHGAEDTDPRQYEQTHDLSAPQTDDDLDDHMEYADEAPVHPLASVPRPPNMGTGVHPQSELYMSSAQPQQHQQLLKLKTEHGYSTAPSLINTPDIVMTNDDDSDTSSAGNSRWGSTDANAGGIDGRSMNAPLPRSALQEETIALFKQYRNLIPCAKCFSRNTIQRDGMSDGNLRFKCRPPVSMSLICNKSYSESKIRNMIAGVVYGPSLPDSANGDNILALPPPPALKSSRRSKNESSPRIGSEMIPDRMQRLDEDQDGERDSEGAQLHPMDTPAAHRASQAPGRRGSAQRHGSTTGDEGMMMEYDDHAAQLHPSSHSSHLQVPGTPPLEGDDSRYRSRPGYGHQGRAGTPGSTTQQQPPQAPGRQLHKLHHSHSHPNIGQVRHQQFLEQQEREHRGSVGYPNQQQQRAIPRQMTRRDSSQYLGGVERRSSHPSPVMNPAGPKYEALSPALSSPPRSSPGHEPIHHQHGAIPGAGPSHEPPITPTSRAHHGSGRYDENSNAAGYFQRRMSQPQTFNNGGHSGLPPPLPSPLAHPYDRRPSEAEEYPQIHREKYERLNASTMLTPNSATGSSRQHKSRSYYTPGSPNSQESRQHPLDAVDSADDTRQAGSAAMTPNMKHSSVASPMTSPWMSHQGVPPNSGASMPHHPSSEPMRYSHSLPMNSRPPLRHYNSSSSLYYQSHRAEDKERFDSENDREVSPEYQEVDADGRPVSRARPHGLKRKSVGQTLGRSISNQNLYSTNLQHHYQYQQHQQQHQQHSLRESYHASDLNSAMPRSSIKMTCYPNSNGNNNNNNQASSKPPSGAPLTTTLDSSEATAMQLNDTSRIVIEIRQPRSLQSYGSVNNLRDQVKISGNVDVPGRDFAKSMMMYRSTSHPNLQLARASSHAIVSRRSPSPERRRSEDREDISGPSTKKRKAETNPHHHHDEPSSAAAVTGPSPAIQVIGVDYLARNDEGTKDGAVGLGFSTQQGNKTLTSSPSIEALRVAKGSSYGPVEDQKEMGIDYSSFTRVETAGWRILIPPNVVASFRSEDFGLMLKPEGLEEDEATAAATAAAAVKNGEEISTDERKAIEMSPMDQQRKAADVYHPRQQQHRILSEAKDDNDGDDEDEEDVNVVGVSRIALRDDDRDELAAVTTSAGGGAAAAAAAAAQTFVTPPQQNDDDQDMCDNAEDVEMDKDELLEDD